MEDKKTDEQIVLEQLIQDYEAAFRRMKEKLMMAPFKMAGLSEEEKAILSALIRETLLEIAQIQVPEEFRDRLGPELTRRIDEMMKAFLPSEH